MLLLLLVLPALLLRRLKGIVRIHVAPERRQMDGKVSFNLQV
jgi:hypothetical protein